MTGKSNLLLLPFENEPQTLAKKEKKRKENEPQTFYNFVFVTNYSVLSIIMCSSIYVYILCIGCKKTMGWRTNCNDWRSNENNIFGGCAGEDAASHPPSNSFTLELESWYSLIRMEPVCQ